MKSESGRSRRLLIALFICLMAVCVGLACVFTACKSDDTRDETGGGEAATVTGLTLSEESLTVYAGSSKDFTVTVTMSDNTTSTDYTVVSSDESVATVSQSGSTVTVTGVAAGDTKITVTAGEFTASCAVTVSADSVATVELSKDTVSVPEDGTTTITVTVKMTSGATSTDFTAVSADEKIATVDVTGSTITVTGVAAGKTKITVTAGGITKECEVEVTTPVISEVTLSKSNVTIGTGETASIDVTVTLDNGKTTDDYTASVSCEPENIVTAEVISGVLTITADGTEGSVKVIVTVGTLTADCNVTVADVQKEYYFDFSDAETYGWLVEGLTPTDNGEGGEMYTLATSTSYTTGIVTYTTHSSGNNTVNSENAGALFTAGTGSNFTIDLSAFEGLYVSITVKMSTNGDNGNERTLYINNNKSTSSGLKSVTSSGKEDYQTLEYGEIISAGETLYLTWSANIRIFMVEIKIMDPDDVTSEVRDVTLDKTSLSLYVEETDYLTATVEMTIGDFTGTYEWFSSDESIARVEGSGNGATIIAVSGGTATITVKAGGKEATCTVTVKEEGTASQEESFIVPIAGSEEGLSSDSFSSGSAITDNSLFTVTADIAMKYYGGSTGSSSSLGSGVKYGALQDGSNAVSFTDMSGTTHNPDQGIQVSNGITAGQTEESILTITAKEDIQLYVYVSWANDGYSSNKSGTIFYSVDGGEKVENSLTARKTIWTISVELSADQTLVIGATNNESSDSAKLWFFGAEAKLLDGTTGGGSSSGDFEELEGYEWIDFVADIASAYSSTGATSSSTKSQSAFTDGKFTFPSGMYYESGVTNMLTASYDVNTQGNNSITVELTGVYNNISFIARGDGVTVGIYKSGSSEALCSWTLGSSASTYNYNTSTGYYLESGTYLITTSSSARLAAITAYEYVEESDPVGINAEAATVDFLYGRNISESDLGLIVTLVYENTRTEPVSSGYTTDLATIASTLQPGANTVTVTYSFTDSKTSQSYEFSTTVTIYLYELESIEISDFSMSLVSGTYYTNNVQKVYLVGDTVSYANAAVTATASYGSGDDKVSTTFILTSSEVTFATADSTGSAVTGAFSTSGAYTVTATVDASLKTGDAVTADYTVNVVDATNADTTTVRVIAPADEDDGNYAIAEKATYAPDSDGIITVATINDAIQLIKLLDAPEDVRKYIYVGAGQYWEKIYIDIPNLTIVGANSYDEGSLATRQDSTTGGTEIVYWAFNGLMDPSGTTNYSTVGSATVTVAKEAVGFCAANITFRNYWNTNALYLECKAMYNDTQADAAYINADKVYFYNVTFTGYHDTLEAENGRQYYDHCYIEGRTDYIFGNTATCYFSYCNIHTIGAGDSNNGGYVMAVKGTGVDYGYIFNYCNFTSDLKPATTDGDDAEPTAIDDEEEDEDTAVYTVEGTVSVARTWSGSDMHIAILNSTFDAGYSKEAYTSSGKAESGKNPRYTHMTAGQAPTPEYLVEYGNSGDGAISESIENTCTVYTDSGDVADYLDFTKIFAIQNGSVKYDDDWSGASVELVNVKVTANGINYEITGYKNSLTVGDIIAQIKSEDATVEITVLYDEAGNALDETAKISADMTLTAETVEADMTVPSSVTYDFGYDAADVTITESGYYGYLDIQLGTGSFYYNGSGWFILAQDATISVKLSAGSVISVKMYATDALLVNGEDVSSSVEGTEGNCSYTYTATTDGETITFSAATGKTLYIDEISVTVYVTYNIGDAISFVSATGVSITGSVGEYAGIIVDATSGKLTDNNGSCCQIGEGLVLKIYSTPGASAVVYFYQNDGTYAANYTVETDEDGVITITITGPADTNTNGSGNMYITSIEIVEKTA